jgi:hypothetical protein
MARLRAKEGRSWFGNERAGKAEPLERQSRIGTCTTGLETGWISDLGPRLGRLACSSCLKPIRGGEIVRFHPQRAVCAEAPEHTRKDSAVY